MSDNLEDFLSHHGVLGMHWGVHNHPNGAKSLGVSVKTSKGEHPTGLRVKKPHPRQAAPITKQDQKWAKNALKHFPHEIYNDAAHQMNNGGIERFNNKPQYRDKDLSFDSPLRRQYLNDYKVTFTKLLNDTSKHHASPSGSLRIQFDEASDGTPIWKVVNNG